MLHGESVKFPFTLMPKHIKLVKLNCSLKVLVMEKY